ncbi:MAG TPA: hypothetical protein VF713_21250 [Thermoanaerobaculia bacterium]
MDGFDIDLATYKMGDDPAFDEVVRRMTPGERVALTWAISKAVWMRETGSVDEPVFRRDVVRIIRPGSNDSDDL